MPRKEYDVGTQRVIVHSDSKATGGSLAVLEMHHPPGTGAPPHWHRNEDEGFFVIQGEYRFILGEETCDLSTGEFLFAPREVVHGFRSVGPEIGKLLVTFTPGGGERYFEEMSAIEATDPERRKKCMTLDAEYGITIARR